MLNSVQISSFDLSKPRVRYAGRVLDKCSLSSYIHDVAVMVKHDCFPLYTDIYWDSCTYSELKEQLIKFINRF